MYYIWSFLITIFIFIIIQYSEYKKYTDKYILYSFYNLTIFVLIYMMTTILFYFMFPDNNIPINIKTNLTENINIDPSILKKIPEKIYTGFTPNNNDK